MLARFRAFVRLRRARAVGTIGLLRLLLALARGHVDEVWIGDSHSVQLNTGRPPSPGIEPVAPRRWVWHLGPRVMFSIARNDFPPMMRRAARLLRRVPAARRAAWIFTFGEIDIRCHLAPRIAEGEDFAFVARYVERVHALVGRIGAPSALVVVPVPPSVDVLDHAAFPVAGTPDERLAAHRAVRERLVAAAAGRTAPVIRLLDVTSSLADPIGLMRPEFTDDGCHTNEAGRAVVRRELARHGG